MVRSMERAASLGQTTAHMKETLSTTTSKVSVFITGAIKEFTEATGRTTKWKAGVFSSGLMAESTKGSISMIRKKDKEHSTGPTVANMRVLG
jgi:hypothetical protein